MLWTHIKTDSANLFIPLYVSTYMYISRAVRLSSTSLLVHSIKLVLIYRPRRDGRLSWPWVAGWLHTEINVRHWEINPNTVAHLSTNQARCKLTSTIEANMLTTNQTASHTYIHRYDTENVSQEIPGVRWHVLQPA